MAWQCGASVTKGTVPIVTQHEPCRLSGHFVAVDVAAFAVYNRPVIALHASKLAQSSDGAVVHGSF